jgi:hypothetical protein
VWVKAAQSSYTVDYIAALLDAGLPATTLRTA